MPGIDVTVSRIIRAPRDLVADFAGNPDNAPIWQSNVAEVQWRGDRPARVGSRLSIRAWFLGQTHDFSYEITDLAPGHSMTLRALHPVEVVTTYHWCDSDRGCRMILSSRGATDAFDSVEPPILTRAVRKAANRDLKNLANLSEAMFGPF